MDLIKYVIYGFIALIIIIFSGVILGKGWGPVKYILNYGEEEVVKDVPDAIANEFYNITAGYEKCFNSKDDNCLCNVKILLFPKGYNLLYTKRIIEIVKGEVLTGPIKRYDFDINKNINCYVRYDNTLKIEYIQDPSYLPLDTSEKKVLIKKPKGAWSKFVHSLGGQKEGLEDYYEYPFLDNKLQFYKQENNICFVLKDELSSEGQAYIKVLAKCSPKPLNTLFIR